MATDPDHAGDANDRSTRRSRSRARRDRKLAAADRAAAARELAEAVRLRLQAANDLKSATTDELTGAWVRKFGLEEASRELARAYRTGVGFALAFVDVDGLKQVNDRRGHLAGDTLLERVGETIRAHIRPYDVIVRYGGDEFVCVMSDLGALEARERFDRVAEVLGKVDAEHSVTFGLAEAVAGESLEALIARADADLLEARRFRRRRIAGRRSSVVRLEPRRGEGR
jgi:diguanylate cyclase (GGDEF)-like protein